MALALTPPPLLILMLRLLLRALQLVEFLLNQKGDLANGDSSLDSARSRK